MYELNHFGVLLDDDVLFVGTLEEIEDFILLRPEPVSRFDILTFGELCARPDFLLSSDFE